ncbi:hypothetical protein [Clostridium sp. BSD9I1]|uniref:hypothetical protein n=1 Tax=Clostridium sp. BSD9I1 TaxID=2003589 RepID=UPI001644B1BA|nr:hypothetical protein [Clostridium sp. BSD9I1]
MSLLDLRDLLLTVTQDTFHYHAHKKPDKYIVWAEDGEAGSNNADDNKVNQVIQGTIDYFTKMEFDPNFDLIQEKLNSINISWSLNSVQYEEDTGYIHYEWIWEMI